MCKQVSKEGESSKVAIRNIRRDAVDKLEAQKKANELSEDDLKDAEKDVPGTDRQVCQADRQSSQGKRAGSYVAVGFFLLCVGSKGIANAQRQASLCGAWLFKGTGENRMENTNPRRADLPQHIGIIMDGNGRWAKKRALPRKYGHREGAKTFPQDCGILRQNRAAVSDSLRLFH